jgi:hypothetical protein
MMLGLAFPQAEQTCKREFLAGASVFVLAVGRCFELRFFLNLPGKSEMGIKTSFLHLLHLISRFSSESLQSKNPHSQRTSVGIS